MKMMKNATSWARWKSPPALMVTGGEAAEEARMTRADRGMLREAILAAAKNLF